MTPVDSTSLPVLSLILPAPERLGLLERVVAALARQSLAPQMELVLIVEHPDEPLPAWLSSTFGWVQVVPRRTWTTMTEARAAGVLHAQAPLVVFCEDHCYPTDGWAEALVAAHKAPWAAVGPAILNANPVTRVSWANLSIEYGPWLHPVRAGACAHVPGHNSCYKRSVLLDYGERMAAMMEAESVMHWDLQQRGLAVAMEPAARTHHENFSRVGPSLLLRFSGGRLFAASRALGWPVWRRALYTVGAAALPFVRTWRALGDLRRVNDTRPRRGLALTIFLLLTVDAIGEAAGYAVGAGDQSRRLSAIEHDRRRFMSARDRVPVRG
jgi:hypothetical protein